MFSEIKSIVFKIKILTCLLLYRSFGNVIHNIAANSNGLLFASDIRNLEKCYKKRNKALLDINFLKNCKTLNVLSKFTQFDIPLVNKSDIRFIKKQFLKNALHKRCRAQKNLHVDLEKKIQFINVDATVSLSFFYTILINAMLKKRRQYSKNPPEKIA